MKKEGILIIFLFAFLIPIVSSAMEPSRPFCEHQGYTFVITSENYTKNEMICVFDEENNCSSGDFYEGLCGQEYLREFPCRGDGEFVWPKFEKCCDGLTFGNSHGGFWIFRIVSFGQLKCEPIPNWFDRYIRYSWWFGLVILGIIILLVILLIISLIKCLKKRK